MDKKRIVRRDQVKEDLVSNAAFVGQDDASVLLNFLDTPEAGIQNLSERPFFGKACFYSNPALSGLRYIPIAGFRNYQIFYRVTDDAVEIIRIMLSARDLENRLTDEPA